MNDKQRERWAKIRAKGKLRYVLVIGLLKIGLSYSVLQFLAYLAVNSLSDYWDGIAFNLLSHLNLFSLKVIIWLASGAVFGLLTSLIIWSGAEKSYRDSGGANGNWDNWNKQGNDSF